MKVVELVPSAKRLGGSLRDVGYSLSAAVADLVDNSISALATEVQVDFHFEGDQSWIRIADNGIGMPPDKMNEALRFGTSRLYDQDELGKFGLGLKSASLSQSRRFTVASRTQTGKLEIRCWDLDHMEQTNRWELLVLEPSECPKECIEPLHKGSGTVIFWEQLDRIEFASAKSIRAGKNELYKMYDDVVEHLGMVFHRFLGGQAKRQLPLKIFVKGRTIAPWDPFALAEPCTQVLERRELLSEDSEIKEVVVVQPYILPTEAQFSSSLAHRKAAGPKKWNHQQGFYMYRADRMIQSGGWNRIRTPDEKTKQARIAVDFPTQFDTAFKIDIAKKSVHIPASMKKAFEEIGSSTSALAQQAYRSREGQSASSFAGSTDKRAQPTTSNSTISPAGSETVKVQFPKETSPKGKFPAPEIEATTPLDESSTVLRTQPSVKPHTPPITDPVKGRSREQTVFQSAPPDVEGANYLPPAANALVDRVVAILVRELGHDRSALIKVLSALKTEIGEGFAVIGPIEEVGR